MPHFTVSSSIYNIFAKYNFRNFLKRQHRVKLLVKAREVEEELAEDLKILQELKSFTAKKGEEERLKVLEARIKQVEWLDGVSTSFISIIGPPSHSTWSIF